MKRPIPASAVPSLPDRAAPSDYTVRGGITEAIRERDAEIARLKGELEAAKRELRQWQGVGESLRLGAVMLLKRLEESR